MRRRPPPRSRVSWETCRGLSASDAGAEAASGWRQMRDAREGGPIANAFHLRRAARDDGTVCRDLRPSCPLTARRGAGWGGAGRFRRWRSSRRRPRAPVRVNPGDRVGWSVKAGTSVPVRGLGASRLTHFRRRRAGGPGRRSHFSHDPLARAHVNNCVGDRCREGRHFLVPNIGYGLFSSTLVRGEDTSRCVHHIQPPPAPPTCFRARSPVSSQDHDCVIKCCKKVLLVVLCGTLPQHGLMGGAMSAPRIQTHETLGHQSRVCELNHSAMGPAPENRILKDCF
nr:uncharacterized protein LOC111774057 [Equus caballus]